ncbi:hypothetical protein ACFWGA_08705, partial [Amycolatopsis lurida]
DDEERLLQLRRCLDDEEIPLPLRVAGVLTILYGLSVTTIVQLRHDHMVTTATGSFLTIAGHQLALPPRLTDLLERLAAPRPPVRGVPGLMNSTSPLLFAGTTALRPMAANSLCARMAEQGITVLPARNSARLALATRLPAAVFAHLTGVEVETAVDWNHRAGHDWTAYVAARQSPHTAPEPSHTRR